MHNRITRCPNCQQSLQVTELTCPSCHLQLRGEFERGCPFCALDPEQRHLLDLFLASRGVLRDMEKALGLSYPTVRSRVDALLAALGYLPTKAEADEREDLAARRRQLLDRLEAAELTAEEAAARLKDLGG
jgi:hypothetical protein